MPRPAVLLLTQFWSLLHNCEVQKHGYRHKKHDSVTNINGNMAISMIPNGAVGHLGL